MLRHPSGLEYTFTLAWSIHGAIKLPEGRNRLDFTKSKHRQVYICKEIPDDVQQAIFRQARGNAVFFKRIGVNQSSLGDAHKQQVDRLIKEAEDKSRDRVILCYHSSGIFSGDIEFNRCSWEDDDACLHLNAFDDSALIKQAKDDVCLAKLALSREFKGDLEYDHILDSFGYKDSSGRQYFRVGTVTSGARFYLGKRVGSTFTRSISSFLEDDRKSNTAMDMPMALFSILTRVDADPLLAFASGWAALDSLVEEAERIYYSDDRPSKKHRETKILVLIKESQCLPEEKAKTSRFLKRFAAATDFLFGMDAAEDVCATIGECWDEYKKRNSLYHDGENVDSPPSIDFLSRTLAKYLYAFLDCKQMRQRE